MIFDPISGLSNVSNNYSSGTEKTDEMSKDTFLKLLVAELQNQNPLEPMQNKDFVNQMVQFSSMEQLSNMSQSLQDFLGNMNSTMKLQAASVVGQYAVIQGNEINLADSTADQILYSVDAEGVIKITITDSEGKVVRTETLGNKEAGMQTYLWDGRSDDGILQQDGTYNYQFSTFDESGNEVDFGGVTGGVVQAVQFVDGEIYVVVDGEKYAFDKIIEISQVAPETPETPETQQA